MRVTAIIFSVGLSVIFAVTAKAQEAQSADLTKSNELNTAAVKLFDQAKYSEALPLEVEALALREKALGPNHGDLIPLLTNLAEIQRSLKNWDEAAGGYRRAGKLAEKTYPPNDIRLASMFENLALIEYENKHTSVARDSFERALRIRESQSVPDNAAIANTAYNLALLYSNDGDYKRAAELLTRVIRIWESGGEKDRPKLIKALGSYVLVLTGLRKDSEAAKVQHRLGELTGQSAIVNGGVLNGKALALMTPPYPVTPGYRPSGQVQVEVLIDENGIVLTAKAVSSNLPIEFTQAAERAARQSRFSPTFVEGKPVRVRGIIIYNFVRR